MEVDAAVAGTSDAGRNGCVPIHLNATAGPQKPEPSRNGCDEVSRVTGGQRSRCVDVCISQRLRDAGKPKGNTSQGLRHVGKPKGCMSRRPRHAKLRNPLEVIVATTTMLRDIGDVDAIALD